MYKRPRVIPVLTIDGENLVKTTQFKKPRYLGDPINAVKIFNGKSVDELCVLDITASKNNKGPQFDLLKDIAVEAFMPLSYGGGIHTMDQIKTLFKIGYEKVIINSSFIENPKLIREASIFAGSQSVVVSIDVKRNVFGKPVAYIKDGMKKCDESPVELAMKAEKYGAGELIINSIDHDGMMDGYDLDLIKEISQAVSIPVVACGGAKHVSDFKLALDHGAHGVAAGSLFVYYGPKKAVLITAPSEKSLIDAGVYGKDMED